MASRFMRLSLLLVFIISALRSPAFAVSSKKRKTFGVINQINLHGPYIGLITVYEPEENAFFATGVFDSHPKYPYVDLAGEFLAYIFVNENMKLEIFWSCNFEKKMVVAGRRFRVGKVHNKKVIYVRCGIGLVTQVLSTSLYSYVTMKKLRL